MTRSKLWVPLLPLALVGILVSASGCHKKPLAEPPAPPEAPRPVPQARPTPPPEPAPAPKPAPQPPARPSLNVLNSQLNPIYFDFDKSSLRADILSTLEANAVIIKKYPEFDLVIEGHCDERGTIEYNLALGDRRASTAREGLIERGVRGSRIRTISYGEERPVDPGHNRTAWARNRRAEFHLVRH